MKSSRVSVASVTLTFRLICLFLLIATAAAWIDSFWHGTYAHSDSWSLSPIGWRHRIYIFTSGKGGLAFAGGAEEGMAGPSVDHRLYWTRAANPGYASWRADWDFHGKTGFKWSLEPLEHHTGYYRELILPYYALVILLAITPAIWIVGRVLRRRKRRPGFCRQCGYNLTGNVSKICPECGTPTQQDIESVSAMKSPMMNV